MPTQATLPLLGFVGWSGAGKTTLLRAVIPLLRQRGLHCALIKHAHHHFDIDHPGKDSYELRKAGAEQVLVASSHRWALIVEQEAPDELPLETLARKIDAERTDLILVEGFKHADIPKIEVYRATLGKPLLYHQDATIIAVASDTPIQSARNCLDINAPMQVTDFIINQSGLISP